MNITIYKYAIETTAGPIVKYFAIWRGRVYAYIIKDICSWMSGWKRLNNVNGEGAIRYVNTYPNHYHEVSALETLVVCGRGPWDE